MTTHDPDVGAEVIDFAVFLKNAPAEPRMSIQRKTDTCIFCHFLFDEKERSVRCPKCGRNWDCFEALAQIAREWTSLAENRKRLHREVKDLGEARDQLRKEVANLKAAKRRADDVVTMLVAAINKRLKEAQAVPKERREQARWFNWGVESVVAFIKSDEWRGGGQ